MKVLMERILCFIPWDGEKTKVDWSDFGKEAKAALELREVTIRQLLDLVLETEAIDRTNLAQESARLRLLESTTLLGRTSSVFTFMKTKKRRSSFTFSTEERKQQWKNRFEKQLRPILALWMDDLADKMAQNLHHILPDMYDKALKFDVMLAVAVTHCRILAQLRPLLDDMLVQLETKWDGVAELIDKEQQTQAIKNWVNLVVQPALVDTINAMEAPNLQGDYTDSASDVSQKDSLSTIGETPESTGTADSANRAATTPETPSLDSLATSTSGGPPITSATDARPIEANSNATNDTEGSAGLVAPTDPRDPKGKGRDVLLSRRG
ncbi:hypothetical protein AAF712_012404 [Marasmius tenuissimus]|uniref:Uncharacterized protein n=1 Tax=Marasmius tenuissimus TaxID=585030 RepID=A0ABR2ZIL1_9AGAR